MDVLIGPMRSLAMISCINLVRVVWSTLDCGFGAFDIVAESLFPAFVKIIRCDLKVTALILLDPLGTLLSLLLCLGQSCWLAFFFLFLLFRQLLDLFNFGLFGSLPLFTDFLFHSYF